MAEILHQLIGSLSYYLQGSIHPRWCRISAINSTNPYMKDSPGRRKRSASWMTPHHENWTPTRITVSLAPGFRILPRLFGTSRGFPEESKNLARWTHGKRMPLNMENGWRTGNIRELHDIIHAPYILRVWNMFKKVTTSWSHSCRGIFHIWNIYGPHVFYTWFHMFLSMRCTRPPLFLVHQSNVMSSCSWTHFFQKNNLKKLSMSELFDSASAVFLSLNKT